MRSGLNKHKQTRLSHHALKWDTKAPHSRTSWRLEREKHQKLKMAHSRKWSKSVMWSKTNGGLCGRVPDWMPVVRVYIPNDHDCLSSGRITLWQMVTLAYIRSHTWLAAWSTRPFGEWQCPEILLLCWQSRQHLCRINPGCDKRVGGYPLLLLLTHKHKEEQGTRTSKMSLFAPQLLNKENRHISKLQ